MMDWDCREAAKNYVNLSSVLAGFAFAAVILVMQSPIDTHASDLATLQNWSSVSFLVGFFGCIVSSFTFSLISGETKIIPRTLFLVFLGGLGFSISGIYIFWGLFAITNIFLSSSATLVSKFVLGFIEVLSPLYLTSIVFDSYIHGKQRVSKANFLKLLLASYLFIPFGLLSRFIGALQLNELSENLFALTAISSLFVIVLTAIATLVASYANKESMPSLVQYGFWLLLHSFVYASLIVLIP